MSEMDLQPWVARIKARRGMIKDGAKAGLATLGTASWVLSAPRRAQKVVRGRNTQSPDLQLPWLPAWFGLTAKPFHDTSEFPWVNDLEKSVDAIRDELHQVQRNFARAAYDSDRNVKTWKTFYFYLNGKPVEKNLDACPRTKALLGNIPVNGLHVCFSAIEPGGFLQPHTGPTNASLTAHLGLEGCEGTAIYVAGERRPYVEGKVVIFDDSFVHWVEHRGQQLRCTLMVTFWHPELNGAERSLISALLKRAPDGMFDHKPNPLDLPKQAGGNA
jgi:hypothetical protein